uniref:Purine permease 3 n=2 Tax=Zea mays TaxID=4577 RepID=A0A804MP06_MAIZE
MDVEASHESPPLRSKTMRRLLVATNCVMLALGVTGGQLLSRLYFSKGGHRQWLSGWLQTGGWPLLLPPVAASYVRRRARYRSAPALLTQTQPRILLAAAGLGLIAGVDNLLYAWGLEFLPVSTSAILISTQLAFTVLFAFLIVRQRLTMATVNAVALLTVGAVVLGLHVSSDRPAGVTRSQYWLGFTLTLGAAVLYGLFLPLVELTYKCAAGGGRAVTYALVVELQLVMGFVATAFCTVGMIVNKDFQRRARFHSTPRQGRTRQPPSCRVRVRVRGQTPAASRSAMDVEARKDAAPARGKAVRRFLVALNCGMLALGAIGGPLLSRLYFSKGGHRQWLSAWLETGGWPLLLVPVAASFGARRARDRGAPVLLTPPRILLAAAGLGVATGVDDFVYAYGLAYLPVSTSAILISTQLAFTVFFAFLVVRQRLTAASVNAVALLTVGAVVLGLHVSSDRPPGVTRGRYWLGFSLTLCAAALYGLVLPLVELAYRRAAGGGRAVTYALVVEMQLVMGFFATAFCTVGMVVNKDFQAIPREARQYELGEARYYMVLAWAAVLWQCFFLGAVGVIFCVHTLLAGILIAVFIPVTEVAAVIFLHEKFSSEKGVALALSLWGLASYSYGEWSQAKAKKEKKSEEDDGEVAQAVP